MATLQWAHICGYYVRGMDGRLSMIDLIDVIRAPKVPSVIPLCVVACWGGLPNEKFAFGCQLRSPSGETHPLVQEIEVPFQINQPNVAEVRTTATMGPRMVELKQFGVYSVDLVSNEIVVYTLPFHFVPVRA